MVEKRRYLSLPWNEWYQLAKQYYKRYHHLLIPAKYETRKGYKLGKWIERQRLLYNKNSHLISETKKKKLEEIGMQWRLENRYSWEFWLTLCQAYKRENKHLEVPKKCIYQGAPFGEWLSQQKKRMKEGSLEKEREDDLRALGVRSSNRTRRKWDDWYKIVERYYWEKGELNIRINEVDANGNSIGLWLYTQKEKYHKKRKPELSVKQIKKLEALHVRW